MIKTAGLMSQFIPISLFNQGQASKIFERVRKEGKLFVMKNNRPSAIILSPEEYDRLTELEENYYLYVEAKERMERNNEPYLSEAEVMKEMGVTEEDLAGCEEMEIE